MTFKSYAQPISMSQLQPSMCGQQHAFYLYLQNHVREQKRKPRCKTISVHIRPITEFNSHELVISLYLFRTQVLFSYWVETYYESHFSTISWRMYTYTPPPPPNIPDKNWYNKLHQNTFSLSKQLRHRIKTHSFQC